MPGLYTRLKIARRLNAYAPLLQPIRNARSDVRHSTRINKLLKRADFQWRARLCYIVCGAAVFESMGKWTYDSDQPSTLSISSLRILVLITRKCNGSCSNAKPFLGLFFKIY